MSEDKFYGIKHAIDNAILFEELDAQEVADFLNEQVNILDPKRLGRHLQEAVADGLFFDPNKK